MSKSECEAVALFQKWFSDNYLYKLPYEWDITNRRFVKVTRPRELFIHRFLIPPLASVIGILATGYVIQHKRRFPHESELTYLGEILLYIFITGLVGQILIYKLFFIDYAEDVFPALNRLVQFNRNLRKSHIIQSPLLSSDEYL
jgi:hypothetical protein